MSINAKKLKLDLYNKRFEVYVDAIKFYQELLSGEISKETHLKFINSKEAAIFLFSDDPEIYQYLDDMHSESAKVTGFKHIAHELIASPEHFLKADRDSRNALTSNGEMLQKLKIKFKKYLSM
jgi:hypothetical protein